MPCRPEPRSSRAALQNSRTSTGRRTARCRQPGTTRSLNGVLPAVVEFKHGGLSSPNPVPGGCAQTLVSLKLLLRVPGSHGNDPAAAYSDAKQGRQMYVSSAAEERKESAEEEEEEEDEEEDREEEEEQRPLCSGVLGYPVVRDHTLGLGLSSTPDEPAGDNTHNQEYKELHVDEWVHQHPGDSMEELAQCQETPAGEEDSDTDLTYGEVEQRLDLLQQHLNRLESQMTADIQGHPAAPPATDHGRPPPAYSTVTSSPEVPEAGHQGPAGSPASETGPNKSKEPSPVLLHTETLPDGNFTGSEAEQRQTLNAVDSAEQQHQQLPPRFPSGRQASLPDVPSSSGMLGLHRPVSDPGLPGK
ncbi:potassium voltage-gated channel subfamily H member 7-like [Amphiprion ocellaris]|uniref:potassium voltage-gated channel subfamily H member 7-like n=1 Tax=Amphiprion ocellaris TaxID=80972 RepID=UPI0024116597|nr:potassium voltage-gated channel subfamily H member 7-like [Amphiprion ocellaris]